MNRNTIALMVLSVMAYIGGVTARNAEGQRGWAGISLPALQLASDDREELDVLYGPTPPAVVDEMVRIAGVGPGDMVYDLGTGDGRIVIAAAKAAGARGVGVDIDPDRIRQSEANARKAGVTDRVRFVRGDLFETDLRPATVVMMFLNERVDRQLVPKFYRELKPGTRLVSHNHSMGDWQPDESVVVNGKKKRLVHLWVLPANVSGDWELTASGASGKRTYLLSLAQRYQRAGGTLRSGGGQARLREVKLRGRTVEFVADRDVNGRSVPVRFAGRADGDLMEGTASSGSGIPGSGEKWTARRDPATVTAVSGGTAGE